MNIKTPRPWLKSVWIAKRNEPTQDERGNVRTTYQTPVEYLINHQPISASTDIEMFGANVTQMQKAYILDYPHEDFTELDKAYLDGITPENETVNGSDANYVIKSVMLQNLATVVYFEKLSGNNNGRI